ncbi:MAG: hypothetical protein ACLUOC_01680, partial [Peptoniphilaceae bacterium]
MKERIKTVILAALLVLTLVLARQIWLAPPPTGNKLIAVADTKFTDAVIGRMMPAAMVVNFGDGAHTKTVQLKNLWPFYRNILKQNFDGKEKVQWEKMAYKDYLKCHDKPSVVFEVAKGTYSDLFKDVYNLHDLKGEIAAIYFSESEGVIFETEEGAMKPDFAVNLSDINKYIRSLEREDNPSYSSLWERYGIQRAVYISDEKPVFESDVVYENDLTNMKSAYKNDLLRRLLKAGIDDLHEIGEEDSTLYVWGQRTVRLYNNGLLDYKDQTEAAKEVMDPAGAVERAFEFVAKNTGTIDDVYLEKLEPITANGGRGYRVVMNHSEKGLPVFPVKGEKIDAIVVELFNNQVKRMTYLYRNKAEDRGENDKVEGMAFADVVAMHPEIFGAKDDGYDQLLKPLRRVSMCYLDRAEEETAALVPGYYVLYDDELYF